MLIHPCLVARSLYAINVLVLVLIAVSSPQPSNFSIFGAIPDVWCMSCTEYHTKCIFLNVTDSQCTRCSKRHLPCCFTLNGKCIVSSNELFFAVMLIILFVVHLLIIKLGPGARTDLSKKRNLDSMLLPVGDDAAKLMPMRASVFVLYSANLIPPSWIHV